MTTKSQPSIHWNDGTCSFILVFPTAIQAAEYYHNHMLYLHDCGIGPDIEGYSIDLAMIPQLMLEGKVI